MGQAGTGGGSGLPAGTAEEIQAEHERFRGWFENSDRYPHIARLMEAGIDPDDPDTREERFQFSLDCVLDGIAARLAPPSGPEPGQKVQ